MKYIFSLFLFLVSTSIIVAQEKTPIQSDSDRNNIQDASQSISALQKLNWNIEGTNVSGAAIQQSTDDLNELDISGAEQITLTTSFIVTPKLTNEIFAFHIKQTGSIVIKQNGINIFSAGDYCENKKDKHSNFYQDEFVFFTFKDTIQNWEIIYHRPPNQLTTLLTLEFGMEPWVQKMKATNATKATESYLSACIFLTFGVIFFILFFFYSKRTENLYFSLYCIISGSMYFFIPTTMSDYSYVLSIGAILLEFLSLFLAKVQ